MYRKIVPILLFLVFVTVGIYWITGPTQPKKELKEVFTPVIDSNSLKIPVRVEHVDPDTIKADFTPEELIQLQKEIDEYDSLEMLRRTREEKESN